LGRCLGDWRDWVGRLRVLGLAEEKGSGVASPERGGKLVQSRSPPKSESRMEFKTYIKKRVRKT